MQSLFLPCTPLQDNALVISSCNHIHPLQIPTLNVMYLVYNHSRPTNHMRGAGPTTPDRPITCKGRGQSQQTNQSHASIVTIQRLRSLTRLYLNGNLSILITTSQKVDTPDGWLSLLIKKKSDVLFALIPRILWAEGRKKGSYEDDWG